MSEKVIEPKGNILTKTTDGLTVSYRYSHDLISQQRDGQTHCYHDDGLGSTENNYRFTGEQYDTNLNQYYLRARYYDPAIGRFTQMDTWMGRNQDLITLHKYLYAHADPVNGIDPSGNMTLSNVMSAVNISSTLAVASAGLSGYSIGSGGVAIYEGRYADGALDIAFGFMGTGVATAGYKMIKFTFGPESYSTTLYIFHRYRNASANCVVENAR